MGVGTLEEFIMASAHTHTHTHTHVCVYLLPVIKPGTEK